MRRLWCGATLVMALMNLSVVYIPSGHTATATSRFTPIQVAPDVTVTGIAFGRASFERRGVRFEPVTSFPMVLNQGYGWRLTVETSRRTLNIREDVSYLTVPKHWGVTGDVSLWGDRRGATTTSTMKVQEGKLENFWSFSEGDPLGAYSTVVWVEGVKVSEGRFEVY